MILTGSDPTSYTKDILEIQFLQYMIHGLHGEYW